VRVELRNSQRVQFLSVCLSFVSSPWFLRLKRKKFVHWIDNFLQQSHISFLLNFGLRDELLIFALFSIWILMLESIFFVFWIDKFIVPIFFYWFVDILSRSWDIQVQSCVHIEKNRYCKCVCCLYCVQFWLFLFKPRFLSLRSRKTSILTLCFYL